jgi:tripartite-type tricarboxylate transporter receptor subunit TctC
MQAPINTGQSSRRGSSNRASNWRDWVVLYALAVLASFAPGSTHAQETIWPSRTVTVVVGFGAGGITDVMARMASKKLSDELNQAFVVENRVGGAGNVAATYVARSAPDGHTLFFAASSQIAAIPKIQAVNYDPVVDFAPVSSFGSGPFILIIRPSIPARTIPEFVSYAKAHNLIYGSPGPGSITHLISALFLSHAAIAGTHVPFRSGDQALVALLGGQIDMYFSPGGNIMPYAESPQVTILGVAAERRMKQLPNVPTIGEFYPNTVLSGWNGFLVPAKTPKAIIDKLSRHVIAAARDPEIVAHLTKLGVEPGGETPEEFAAQIRSEQPKFDAAIKAANLKLD